MLLNAGSVSRGVGRSEFVDFTECKE
jgi:hypothetical protein